MEGPAAGGYFGGDAGRRKRYYGVKRQIGFRKKFPLSQYSYAPLQRGSALSLQTFGPSWKEATPEQKANRKNFMMSGRGKYAMTGRGGFFGRMLGNMFGMGDLGDKLGDWAWDATKPFLPPTVGKVGDALFSVTDKFSGNGSYTRGRGLYRGKGAYATNNLITDGGATASDVVPVFHPSDLHGITYSNREYVRDVYAPATTSGFTVASWALNPGLVDSFPWLSQIAINFEEYEIVQLVYTYKSTVADFASASGQVGQVVMATQYNPNSDPFADKEEMMLYEGGMSCKTTESLIHGIECDPAKNSGSAGKYVRQGALPPTEDLKNYDLGRTSLAVINCPSTYAGQQLGELWVSYTVRLRKPKFASGNAYNIRRDVWAHPQKAPTLGSSPMNPSQLLIGARNSLGARLIVSQAAGGAAAILPTGTGTDLLLQPPWLSKSQNTNAYTEDFRIVIPDSYSGILCLKVQMTDTDAGNVTDPVVVSLAPNTIFPFYDVPMIGDTASRFFVQAKRDRTEQSASDYNSIRGKQLELHFRVVPPQNGVPNIICVAMRPTLSGTATICYPVIELAQYNSFASVQDNGSNDALTFVNVSGAAALWQT